MDQKQADEAGQSAQQETVDPVQLQYAFQRLRVEQNLAGGVVAGLVAALIGAGVWALVTVLSGYQIEWMAVGVGFLVGFAVRWMGKGIDQVFGIAGSILSLLGCALGNLLTVCAMISSQFGVPLLEVILRLDVNLVMELMVETFNVMDVLFYGIAIYEGYRLSFRQVSGEEMTRLLKGSAAVS
jgi:hypothetical protein